MKLFDSHAHLDFPDFDGTRKAVIKEAFDNGVSGIINIGVDLRSSRNSVELAGRYDRIYAAVGYHPHDASKFDERALDSIREMAGHKKVVAVGETGLDFYRNLSPKDIQYRAFEKQIHLAVEMGLPLVVHVRDAHDEALEVLKSNGAGKVGGVLHCFAGYEDHIDMGREMGFKFSFNGSITFKKSRAPLLAEYAGIENILIETDCPYLAPVPYRGKLNKPVYVRYVAEKLAEIFAPLSVEEIGSITDGTARSLFKIPPDNPGTVAYSIGNSLYLNITNRCSNRCFFCARHTDFHLRGYHLKLACEPSNDEIVEAAGDVSGFDEVVFCGYGEPTIRLDTVLAVAEELKRKGAYIRLNTNGHGSLIHGRDITPELSKHIDVVSISLNASDRERYNKICKPDDPENAFDAMLEFARNCKDKFSEVILTVVDIPGIKIDECRMIADEIGVRFRVREYNKI